jgi:molybdenum cofactor cytidylyltransferase
VAAVVLAAGGATRFGGGKLLAPLRGRPLAEYPLQLVGRARLAGLIGRAVVVVAPEDQAIGSLARQAGAEVVVNPTPEQGLSSSLRTGLGALGEAAAAIVLLADQPLVRLDTLAVLIAAWRERLGVLIRPRYADAAGETGQGEPGHPVLADRSLWFLAEQLAGDAGFGAVRPIGAAGVAVIDLPGRNPDVDTPADLQRLEGFAP